MDKKGIIVYITLHYVLYKFFQILIYTMMHII